ncbi:MAG: TlpA family protein disulfide reductase [Sulfuricella sp.]|nr:TlpA family protein disulfide reductase [Sulfuricella sp.]
MPPIINTELAARLKKFRPDPLTLLLLGLLVFFWFRPPAWVSDEQRALPPLRFELLDGRHVSLEDLRGKVVLVNFWATWCPYCRHEMPAMQRFYADWRERGFEMIALSQDEDAATVRQFLAENAYYFPVGLADAGHAAAFGGVSRLPTSFLIDKQGRLRKKISGQVHYARLEDLVGELLKD